MRMTRHGMRYECRECGHETVMWLERGLEEPADDRKPVPYMVACPRCGELTMRHVDLANDIRLGRDHVMHGDMDRFEDRAGAGQGVPVFGGAS